MASITPAIMRMNVKPKLPYQTGSRFTECTKHPGTPKSIPKLIVLNASINNLNSVNSDISASRSENHKR